MSNTATVEQASKILNQGGIVIFPTETVYGIGCLISFPESIKRLYKIKERKGRPTLALFKDLAQVESYVGINRQAEVLASAFWPGPLTICLKPKTSLPGEILGEDSTLGTRIPGFAWTLELLNQLNSPLLAPSANFKGLQPAKKFVEIDKALFKLVDYVVDVEPGGQEVSTIVSFANRSYNLTREGAIKKQAIEDILDSNKESKRGNQ